MVELENVNIYFKASRVIFVLCLFIFLQTNRNIVYVRELLNYVSRHQVCLFIFISLSLYRTNLFHLLFSFSMVILTGSCTNHLVLKRLAQQHYDFPEPHKLLKEFEALEQFQYLGIRPQDESFAV